MHTLGQFNLTGFTTCKNEIIMYVLHACICIAICYCSMYIVCPYITNVDLYPDVELEINRIETNEGRTDQCRVQFIVTVSDSRLDEIYSTH